MRHLLLCYLLLGCTDRHPVAPPHKVQPPEVCAPDSCPEPKPPGGP